MTSRVHLERAPQTDFWLAGTKGKWRPATIQETGKKTATVSCPSCGKTASLSGHEIDPQGVVTPSLGCPYDSCDFHAWVTLEGWEGQS